MKFKQQMLSSARIAVKFALLQGSMCLVLVSDAGANETAALRSPISKITNGTSSPNANDYNNASEAQDVVVSGTVTDAKGEALPGVSVRLRGTTTATVTDGDGRFTIKVPSASSILEFSYVGFSNFSRAAGSGANLRIVLKEDSKGLDEVVIVGYGVQKKATSTGAQSSLKGAALLQSPVANISNSLVGRVSGLSGVQASGVPGDDATTLRIRGVSTFAGSQEPLVMLDGIQITMQDFNRIDPNEIENVTILKDASSTAVYGIRGANGVILATTKTGKVGPPTLSYSVGVANSRFTDLRSMMKSYDYANSYNQALFNDLYVTNSPGTYVPGFGSDALRQYQAGTDPLLYPDTDWFALMFRKSSAQLTHNLQINGGTEKVRYMVSAGYFTQGGLFNNTTLFEDGGDAQINFDRFNFRANLDFNISDKFKILFKTSSIITQRSGNGNSADITGQARGLIDGVFRANPTTSPGIYDGKLIAVNAQQNPLIALYNSPYRKENSSTLNGSLRLEHKLDFITKGLSTHGELAYQGGNEQQYAYTNTGRFFSVLRTSPTGPALLENGQPVYFPSREEVAPGLASLNFNKRDRLTAEFALNYARDFSGHNITGLVLYNQQKSYEPSYFDRVAAGYQSVVGRTTYAYKGRYIVEANMAYNGSENFAEGKRFGLFPSLSLGWVPTEEAFFPKNKVISFLKFRGSYGEVGYDVIGNNFLQSNNRFLYRPTSFTQPTAGNLAYWQGEGNNQTAIGGTNARNIFENRASNPDLTWERAIKSNAGFEALLFKDKINVTFDLFSEKRDNILATLNNVSATVGNVVAPANFGRMKNQGFEVELGFNDKIGDNATYFIRGNFSFAKNTILEQDELPQVYDYQRRTGNQFRQNFGFIHEGFYNTWEEVSPANRPTYLFSNNRLQPGDVKYRDVNGDGTINFDDSVPLGYSDIPQVTYGTSVGGTFKGFELNVLFQGADRVSLQYTRRNLEAFHDTPTSAAASNLLESWTQERYDQGLPINFPRFGVGNLGNMNNYNGSTLNIVNAAYLRLKNVEIAYNLPASLFKRIGLKSTRVFVNGQNLYTWKSILKDLDPENPNTGANNEPYPLVKTFNFGATVKF